MTTTEIKELFELTAQRVAQIKTESARDIAQIRKEAEGIRKETEGIRKETEGIRKETEYNRKIAEKRADEDFKKMREILEETEYALKKTSGHLGFYTKKVANISEEYFYRGLKSNISVGGMTFDTIVRNIDIDGKEYDIILENDKCLFRSSQLFLHAKQSVCRTNIKILNLFEFLMQINGNILCHLKSYL